LTTTISHLNLSSTAPENTLITNGTTTVTQTFNGTSVSPNELVQTSTEYYHSENATTKTDNQSFTTSSANQNETTYFHHENMTTSLFDTTTWISANTSHTTPSPTTIAPTVTTTEETSFIKSKHNIFIIS
jgi:hypothetical protein